MPRLRKRRGRPKSTGQDPGSVPQSTSRLKRSCRLQEPEQTTVLQKTPATLSPQILERLSKLNSQCETLCQNTKPENDQNGFLLDGIVRECSDLLSEAGVFVVLENARLVPQALRRALNDPNLTTEALTKCFVIFASKFASGTIENDPFDGKASTAKSEVVSAAADWALLMFLKSLSFTRNLPTQKCCPAQTGILVGPRDELRNCVIDRSRANLSYAIEPDRVNSDTIAPGTVNRTTTYRLQSSEGGILSNTLRRIMDQSRASPVSERDMSLLSSVSQLLVRNNGTLFDKLSLEDGADLLYVSDPVYEWHVRRLREKVTPNISWESLSRETEVISRAARKHITLHWKLLDHVREALRPRSGGFRQSWWRSQMWLRATLAQVAGKLSAKEIGERVPPGLRLCMRQTAILLRAMQAGKNSELGVRAAQVLYDEMRLGRRLTLGRNHHAILLVFEALVVRALWACGVQMHTGGSHATLAARVGPALVVACNVDRTVRGRSAESDAHLRVVQNDLVRAMRVSDTGAEATKFQMTNVYQAAIMMGREGNCNHLRGLDSWEQTWLASILEAS